MALHRTIKASHNFAGMHAVHSGTVDDAMIHLHYFCPCTVVHVGAKLLFASASELKRKKTKKKKKGA